MQSLPDLVDLLRAMNQWGRGNWDEILYVLGGLWLVMRAFKDAMTIRKLNLEIDALKHATTEKNRLIQLATMQDIEKYVAVPKEEETPRSWAFEPIGILLALGGFVALLSRFHYGPQIFLFLMALTWCGVLFVRFLRSRVRESQVASVLALAERARHPADT